MTKPIILMKICYKLHSYCMSFKELIFLIKYTHQLADTKVFGRTYSHLFATLLLISRALSLCPKCFSMTLAIFILTMILLMSAPLAT